jgi:hypothetical protein
MNKTLKVVLSVAVVIAIVGAYLFPRVQQSLGAVVGPDLFVACTSQNGLSVCKYKKALTLATTTPCAIKSPAATSTLVRSSVQINTASSTATTWTFAKASTAYATTTYLDSFSLGSGARGTLVSSATTTGADIKQVIAPNTYFVVSKAGDTPAGTGLAGSCTAEFVY